MKYKELYSENSDGIHFMFGTGIVMALIGLLGTYFTNNLHIGIIVGIVFGLIFGYCIDRYVYFQDKNEEWWDKFNHILDNKGT